MPHNVIPSAPAGAPSTQSAESPNKLRRFSCEDDGKIKLFLSYSRGDQTTPFARTVKAFLESCGFVVWMDEEGIVGGADFMNAIGQAIKHSHGIVAVIDKKFCGSIYCNNEMAMAQGNGLKMFPLLFRELGFDTMPAGLQYMLASINAVSFADETSDSANLDRLNEHMKVIFDKQKSPPQSQAVEKVHVKESPVNAPADVLALVPVTVPELPDVMCERPEMTNELRGHLLGFMATGAVSVSSVKAKKRKVATHGQGGVGKTCLAALIVHDPMVRRAFDRIAWVSVGQNPSILAMQQSLFDQLTGQPMPMREAPTPASQLAELQAQCVGKRWLVVLDDIWDKAHEKLLNCIDLNSASKLLVTTRIRGLLKGCDEVSLNLLSPTESIDLLLRTGQVEEPDDDANAAAGRIADLVGHLPLYISICGGIIQDYEGGTEWYEELPEMLKEDRIEVLDDAGEEDSITEHVVDASLNMLKDKDAKAAFASLGLSPEDVLVPVSVAQLMCSADPDNTSKITALSMRRSLKKLLDRHLLQGSVTEGVQMHDIVRDLVRSRLGDEKIREKQRFVVDGFIASCPDGSWPLGDATGEFAAQALHKHMREALLPEPIDDTAAQAWLVASDDVMGHMVVQSAAKAFGYKLVVTIAERFEAAGEPWKAAKHFVLAAITAVSEDNELILQRGEVIETEALDTTLMKRACDLLEKVEDDSAAHSLEVSLRGSLSMRLGWAHDYVKAGDARVQQLLRRASTVKVMSPPLLVGAGWAELLTNMELCGFTPDGEENLHSFESQAKALEGGFISQHFKAAIDTIARNDPFWIVAAAYFAFSTCLIATHRQHELGRKQQGNMTHEFLSDFIQSYDFKVHHQLLQQAPMGMDMVVMNYAGTYSLNVFGDISLTRAWMEKIIDIYEGMDPRTVPTIYQGAYYGGLNFSHSFLIRAGLGDLALRLLKALHLTFTEVEASAETYHGVMRFFAWTGKTHCWCTNSFLISQMKRRHFLLAPEEVGKDAMQEWLESAPAEWGSAGQGEFIDTSPHSAGMMLGGDCVETFEALGRFEEGITAAKTDIKNWGTGPTMLAHAYTGMGRCLAKLDRHDEATASFEAAIAEAQRCELPFLEMLAHRDFIVHVLDKQDKRESQMLALGSCISRMVMAPGAYSAILGNGIDAEAAVAMFAKK